MYFNCSMHIHVVTSHSCIFLCWIPPWRW